MQNIYLAALLRPPMKHFTPARLARGMMVTLLCLVFLGSSLILNASAANVYVKNNHNNHNNIYNKDTFSEALPAQPKTILTWNVENYLNMDRRSESGGFLPNYPKPQREKTALRAVLEHINADVLALQELGSEAHLEELQRDLQTAGLHYPHRAFQHGADPTRGLGVLSKIPFTNVVRHTGIDFAYPHGFERDAPNNASEHSEKGALKGVNNNDKKTKDKQSNKNHYKQHATPGRSYSPRGMLQVSFGQLHIFTLHLKSPRTVFKADPEADTFRRREAQALRDVLRAQYPPSAGHTYLVVGDFNAPPKSPILKRFLSVSSRPLLTLLPAADANGHRWTHVSTYSDTYRRLDYALSSPALEKDVRSVRVLHGPQVEAASDHRPLLIHLSMPQAPGH